MEFFRFSNAVKTLHHEENVNHCYPGEKIQYGHPINFASSDDISGGRFKCTFQ